MKNNGIKHKAEDAIIPKNSLVKLYSESGTLGGSDKYISFTRDASNQRNSILVFSKVLKIEKAGFYKVDMAYKTDGGHSKIQFLKIIEPMENYEVDLENLCLKDEKVVTEITGEFQSAVWSEKSFIFKIDKIGVFDLEIHCDWAFMDLEYIKVFEAPEKIHPILSHKNIWIYEDLEEISIKYEDYCNTFISVENSSKDSLEYYLDEKEKTININCKNIKKDGFFIFNFENDYVCNLEYGYKKNMPKEFSFSECAFLWDIKMNEEKLYHIERKGGLEFFYNAEEKSVFQLEFLFRILTGDQVHFVTVENNMGKFSYNFGFGMSEDGLCTSVCHNIILEKGINKISFLNQSDNFDLSNLAVKKVDVKPILSTVKNKTYMSELRDIYVVAQMFLNKLLCIKTENGELLDYDIEDYWANELENGHQINRKYIIIRKNTISNMKIGENILTFVFDSCEIKFTLVVEEINQEPDLKIINFDIDHGNCSLFYLPNGKKMLVDSGKPQYADKVLLPFLEKNKINIDYFMVTHYHEDHCGRYKEIIEKYNPKFIDNSSVKTGDRLDKIWDLGDLEIVLLNSRYMIDGITLKEDQSDNNTSLSFMLTYKGFKYSHGADNYGKTQDEIIENYKDRLEFLKADVFYGNHHLFGSVNPEFITLTNPDVIFVSANAALYRCAAYTDKYFTKILPKIYEKYDKIVETVVSSEVGSLVIQVYENNWDYEMHKLILDEF